MRQALEALKYLQGIVDTERGPKAIAALTAVLADNALNKMAENAREIGLDYEPVAWIEHEWGGLTDRENAVMRFALHNFMTDAYARMNAAAQDKDSRYFKPGAVEAFAKDAKDAEALMAKLREKNA